jgi:hypothetical protein
MRRIQAALVISILITCGGCASMLSKAPPQFSKQQPLWIYPVRPCERPCVSLSGDTVSVQALPPADTTSGR